MAEKDSDIIMDDIEKQDNWRGLIQLQDGQKLFSPLFNSAKIKYTCIAVSSNHVILGANSGGVYCFTASDFKFTCLLANREGSISVMGFSPLDKHLLAVVAGGCNVCFWEHNLDDINNEAKRFHVSSILRDGIVTDMVWDSRGTRLFYGDNQGRIAIAFVPKFARKFGSSSLFKRVDEIIHVEKGAIVQLDMWRDLLLVSTNERCCLLRLQGENVESLVPVGARAIRNGSFGACFYPRMNGRPPIVYSARPKGRLWAADIVGEVISTVRPREFLITDSIMTPPSSIINIALPNLSPPNPSNTQSSFNFHRLGLLSKQYLVTWQENTLFIQTFHESSFSINMWLSHLQNIVNVVFSDDKMYIFYDNCQSVICLSYLNMSDTLTAIVKYNNYSLILEMLVHHTIPVKQEVPPSVLTTVIDFILKQEEPVVAEIQELIDLIISDGKTNAIDNTSVDEVDGVSTLTQVPVECANNEERNQFNMEGTEDPLLEQLQPLNISDVEDDTEVSITNKQPADAPHTYPYVTNTMKYIEENSQSFTQLGDHTHQSESITPIIVSPTASNIVKPLTARMNGDMLKEEEEDLVVVRSSSREKRRKSKISKKKRNSVDLTKGVSQTSLIKLEDILEGRDTMELAVSPSQLSSNATSLDNSPQTSLPSSPPKPLSIIQQPTTDPMTEDLFPKTSRSLSLDTGSLDENHDKPSRSLSQSFESDILRPTKLLSKVKSMASSQDGSIQKTGRIVKGLLMSSISTATPVAVTSESSNVILSPEVGEYVETDSRGSSCVSSPPPVVVTTSLDIKTQQFIDAVNKAMQSLNTPQILCSPCHFKKSLLEWLEELKLYNCHILEMQKQNQQDQSYACFLSHDLSAKESVNDLIDVCLDLEIYIDVYDDLVSVSNLKKITTKPNFTDDDVTLAVITTDENDTDHNDVTSTDSRDTDPNDITSTAITTVQNNTDPQDTRILMTDVKNSDSDDIPMTSNTDPEDISASVTTDDTSMIATAKWKKSTKTFNSFSTSTPDDSNATNIVSDIVHDVKPAADNNYSSSSSYDCFIKCYSNLMLIDDTRHHLDQKDWTSACVGYRTLASQLEEKDENVDSCLSPRLILKMYQEDKDGLVSLCVQHFPNIQPWEVAAVCHLDVTTDDNTCDVDTYLKYLDLMFTQKIINEIIVHDESLIILSVKVALRVTPTENVKSNTGSPLPNSHLIKWPHEISLIGLTDYCSKYGSQKIYEKVIDLFENAGYWRGYLELGELKNMKQRVWATVSSLSNYSLLHNLVKKGFIFDTPISWQSFTSMLTDVSVEEVTTNNQWTWENIVREMLSVIGVDESGKILQGLNLQCTFPSSLYHLLTGIAIVHREQRTIAHNLLEIFDRYLWSVRPHSLGPYLLNLYQKEEANVNKGEISQELTSPPPGSHPNIPLLFMEDTAAHWGIKLNTTECMICGYAVALKVSDKEKGAIAYRCGHLYHRHCLPEQACVICFVKNYNTMLSFL